MNVILKLLFYIIVLVLILILAYLTTRAVGRSAAAGGRSSSKNIRILEKAAVSRDSFLAIVEVQGRFMLVGVSPSGMSKISDLDSYEITEDPAVPMDFKTALKSQLMKNMDSFPKPKKKNKDRED